MAGGNDSDPLERYFRPRPGGGASSAGDRPEPSDEAPPAGVTVAGAPAPRVSVRGPRRPGSGTSRQAAASARRQRRFLSITGVFSVFVLIFSGVAWGFQSYVTGSIDRVDVGGLGEGESGEAMTILVAGVDRRDGLTREQQAAAHLGHEAGERSDVMLLVHISADHDRISIISLPRDSLVTIPGHRSNGVEGPKGAAVPTRYGKLTWAYQYGGPSLSVATVKRATGLSIDHYVEVNFYGFVRMIDALGGVEVCLDAPVDDRRSGLRLPAGTSRVNGLQGLAFARARYTLTNGSDIGRIDRQQQLLAAMLAQGLSSRTLTDPAKSSKFLDAALKSLRVDRRLAENLPSLVRDMSDVSTDSVAFVKLPLTSENYMTPINGSAPQSTVLWDRHKAAELFTRIRRDQPPVEPSAAPSPTPSEKPADALTVPPGNIQVLVRNGVGTPGLAATAGASLRKAGFQVTVVPGLARRGLRATVVQHGPGRADSARTLAAAIPGAKTKQLDALGDKVQVIVGADWDGAEKVKVTAPETTAPGAPPEVRTATEKVCK